MSRGEKYIHVYEIELKPYETPIFYRRDGNIMTLVSDPEYPHRHETIKLLRDQRTPIARTKPLGYECDMDRVVIPFFGMQLHGDEESLKDNILAIAKYGIDVDNFNDHSIFMVRKRFEDDLWDVGACLYRAHGGERFTRNEMLERYTNRMMGLKAFW